MCASVYCTIFIFIFFGGGEGQGEGLVRGNVFIHKM